MCRPGGSARLGHARAMTDGAGRGVGAGFGGGDVSVPVCFGDPVLVDAGPVLVCRPQRWSGRDGTRCGYGSRARLTRC